MPRARFQSLWNESKSFFMESKHISMIELVYLIPFEVNVIGTTIFGGFPTR